MRQIASFLFTSRSMQCSPKGAPLTVFRVVLLTCLASAPLYAQRWSDLVPVGARVRVQTSKDDETYVGQFTASPVDSLNIAVPSRDPHAEAPLQMLLPSSYVKSVDVSRGHSRLTRGLLGFAIGGVTGGIVGAAIGNHLGCPVGRPTNPVVGQCWSEGSENEIGVAILGITGVVVGGVGGGVVGAATAPELWRNVYTRRLASPNP